MSKIITISLMAIAVTTGSSIAVSGGGIPQGFPANINAIGNMPSQATNRQPAFPPSRAIGSYGAQVQSFPSMPSQSIQGTSRIPTGPGLDGFNNRGSRRP